jgi:hypothetical protein
MKTIALEYPDRLHEQLAKLVAAGWFKSSQGAALEALFEPEFRGVSGKTDHGGCPMGVE